MYPVILNITDRWSNVYTPPEDTSARNKIQSLRTIDIITICVQFLFIIIGGPANIRVVATILRHKLQYKSRYFKLVLHLAIADTIVCLLSPPIEIGWRLTYFWKAGDFGCRVFQFIRVFGLYASSMVLIVISIDRYYAVSQPFIHPQIGSRINKMLVAAWILATLLSIPQMIIYRLVEHDLVPGFFQCLSTGFFTHDLDQKHYLLLHILFMYGLPLCVFVTCYAIITAKVIKQQAFWNRIRPDVSASGTSTEGQSNTKKTSEVVISSPQTISRMRSRSVSATMILKRPLVIIITFFVCWTPHVLVTLWSYVDYESYMHRNETISSILYLFAVSNTMINPFIYGQFTNGSQRLTTRIFDFFKSKCFERV